jgi:putative transposase
MAQQPRFGRQCQPLLTLVQMRQQHREPGGQLLASLGIDAHTTSSNAHSEKNRLYFYGLTRSPTSLTPCPRSAQPGAKAALAEIWNVEDREHAERAVTAFEADYGAKWPKAVAKITDDVDVLLAFYDYPPEHWVHLRTTNPIESTFATVRLRQRVTKGPGSRAAGVAMAFKLIESAQTRWRAVNAPHLVALVRAGARFKKGKLVERPDESGRDQQVA